MNINFNNFLVCKKNGNLQFRNGNNYENRNQSTQELIYNSDYIFNFKDFDWIVVNTDDNHNGKEINNMKIISYSTTTNDFSQVCPDFVFDCWKEVHIDNYQRVSKTLSELGKTPPKTDCLGWRGALTHENRNVLVKYDDKKKYDVEIIEWNRNNPNKLSASNYVSLYDHVVNWRYLIDIEGRGYSGRLKLFFFTKRVVFLQDRPEKEWFFPKLKPWVHYVPIDRDLKNLDENYNKLLNNPDLEKYIIENGYDFAMTNLTRLSALQRWYELIETL